MSDSPQDLAAVAAQLKVLAHPGRLAIIDFLRKDKGQSSVTDVYQACELPQAIASQLLISLKDRGILSSKKVGTKIFYSIAQPWCLQVLDILKKQVA